MIHSARPTVSPVANIVFDRNLFCFEKWGRTDGRTDDMCSNNDHYRRWINYLITTTDNHISFAMLYILILMRHYNV